MRNKLGNKRIFDLAHVVLLTPLIIPLLIATAIFVRILIGKNIIFKQQRPGLHGKVFTIYKFRTMTDERDQHGSLLSDEDRLTKAGKFLRSTSLDELPELWNVVKGDMSLVGPRPLLIEYLSLYTPAQAQRHNVRPGITGLAQVRGRNTISFIKRLKYDVWYVKNSNILIDYMILFETFTKVIKRKDVQLDSQNTSIGFKNDPS